MAPGSQSLQAAAMALIPSFFHLGPHQDPQPQTQTLNWERTPWSCLWLGTGALSPPWDELFTPWKLILVLRNFFFGTIREEHNKRGCLDGFSEPCTSRK